MSFTFQVIIWASGALLNSFKRPGSPGPHRLLGPRPDILYGPPLGPDSKYMGPYKVKYGSVGLLSSYYRAIQGWHEGPIRSLEPGRALRPLAAYVSLHHLIDSFIHPFTPFVYSFIHPSIHIHPPIHLLVPLLVHSFIHLFINSFSMKPAEAG